MEHIRENIGKRNYDDNLTQQGEKIANFFFPKDLNIVCPTYWSA